MPNTIEVIKDIRKLCTHVFEGGHKCASPALRNETFCYYHHPTRRPVRGPQYSERQARAARRIARQSFAFALPTTEREYHAALHEVVARIAANQIDARRAGLLLMALQIARPTRQQPENRQ